MWGSNSYVDIEIKSANVWTRVYRIGNPNASDQDSYNFPSSTSYDSSTGGVSITFNSDNWKYVTAGTNMSDIVRLKFYAGSTNNSFWIINEYSGTAYHESQMEGYITYVQEHPLAN